MPLEHLTPSGPEELAGLLRESAEQGRSIELGGAFSKRTLGGSPGECDVRISTAGLNRLLMYEPADLTISVEAGMPWAELTRLLNENNQMIPLDPPFAGDATVGGVAASDSSGPRRRRFGTARDMVIGMEFATLEGKLVQSGGMVVKNVTGLDMAKLMVGSFGTLAAIARVNFKLTPKPAAAETYLFGSDSIDALGRLAGTILKGQLQPVAVDLLSPQAGQGSRPGGFDGAVLAVEAMGTDAVVQRCRKEFAALAADAKVEFSALGDAGAFWGGVQDFQSRFARSGGVVLRVSCTLTAVGAVVQQISEAGAAALARAGNSVVYAGCAVEKAPALVQSLRQGGYRTTVEYAPGDSKPDLDLAQIGDGELDIMKRIKGTLDPGGLLNPGRLYGRI